MAIGTKGSGRAYDLGPGTHNPTFTEVGKGTPCGEFLRRYWHPVATSADATTTPAALRILGEDLVLYRDRAGTPGLLHARCCHRGASLHYGRVEDEGIRCCYHGWLFDAEGRCLHQMSEPDGGARRGNYRQPWYPVIERYGLIFAYLGPESKQPVLPRYNLLDDLDEGEFLEVNDRSLGAGGGVIAPFNWFQHFENVVDPMHAPILHGMISGVQFVPQMGILPEVSFEYSELGVIANSYRTLDNGLRLHRRTEAAMPTLRVVPNPRVAQYARTESIGWILPLDDTSFRIYVVGRVRSKGEIEAYRTRFNGKLWAEMSEAEHRSHPGDWEAMASQGPITLHSHEHLASSDKGVAMLRRFIGDQIQRVQAGADPVGVRFDEADARINLDGGQYLIDAQGRRVDAASTS
ncbi:MAG: Rieske 2Fe-2S domain-containing protein [Lautropia sp.]